MQLDSSTLILAGVVILAIIVAGALFGYVVYRSTRRPPQARSRQQNAPPQSAPPLAPRPSPHASAPPPPAAARPAPGSNTEQTQLGRAATTAKTPVPGSSEPTREIARPAAPAQATPAQAGPPPAPPPEPQPSAKREAKNLFDQEAETLQAPVGVPQSAASEQTLVGGAFGGAAAPALSAEEVRFSTFYPKEAGVSQWYTLLVYAYLDSALAQVQADAAKYKDEMGGVPRQAQSSAPAYIARGTEITLIPELEGVEFNPERITFKWVEDMHRNEFRLRAASSLAGLAGNGTVTVFVGPVIVATVKFGMLFSEATQAPATPVQPAADTASTTAKMYSAEQIFISYSHADSAVALACRNAYKAIGYDVLIDVESLRSGELWNDALMRLIDRADIFQLFWSQNSAQSKFCREEWEYALGLSKAKGGSFIRPVYWQKPLVPPPDELEPLHFAFVPLAPLAPEAGPPGTD